MAKNKKTMIHVTGEEKAIIDECLSKWYALGKYKCPFESYIDIIEDIENASEISNEDLITCISLIDRIEEELYYRRADRPMIRELREDEKIFYLRDKHRKDMQQYNKYIRRSKIK